MEPTDLLEKALPPLPPDLQIAPLKQLRGRIRRRRRRVRAGLLAAIVLTVGVGIGVPLAGRKGDVVAWQYARIDRTGTILTIFALGTCLEAASRADARSVAITVRLAGRTCRRVPLVVHLTAALGARALVDGADGRIRTGFPDRDLPLPPAGADYAEIPGAPSGTAADPVSTVTWTRPGGPDLRLTARPGRSAGPPAGPALGSARLGVRTGAYYRDGTALELRWDVGDLVYELAVRPAPPSPVSGPGRGLAVAFVACWIISRNVLVSWSPAFVAVRSVARLASVTSPSAIANIAW